VIRDPPITLGGASRLSAKSVPKKSGSFDAGVAFVSIMSFHFLTVTTLVGGGAGPRVHLAGSVLGKRAGRMELHTFSFANHTTPEVFFFL